MDGTLANRSDLVARLAVAGARPVASARHARLGLLDELGRGVVVYPSIFGIDPTAVALADKVALSKDCSRRLRSAPGVTIMDGFNMGSVSRAS